MKGEFFGSALGFKVIGLGDHNIYFRNVRDELRCCPEVGIVMRQASTYDIYATFGEEIVAETVTEAERFLRRIKEILREAL